ncbi:MAG: PorT family protein [Bacteroidales bacterium]|nr:PorT family protein [Bacteroidales bacterium]
MKRLIVLSLSLLIGGVANAQFFQWGVKGGAQLGYVKLGQSPKITSDVTTTGKAYIMEQGSKQWGFHLGAFVQLNMGRVYLQPELLFTQAKGEVVLTELDNSSAKETLLSQRFNRFDIPLLLGMRFGIARLYLGPVATFTLNENGNLRSKMQEITAQTVDNKFNGASVGFQVGAGIDLLSTLALDVRYEGGLSKLGESIVVGGKAFGTDQRCNQLILSVGVYF